MKIAEVELLRDAVDSTINGVYDDHEGWRFEGHTREEYRDIVARAKTLVGLQGAENTAPPVLELAQCFNDLKPGERDNADMLGWSVNDVVSIIDSNLLVITPEMIEQELREAIRSNLELDAPLTVKKPIVFRR